jgi:predicted alpha/beta hydrolase family esterase
MAPVLIIPGYHGSGPEHWQSWLERELPTATRVTGIDWNLPVLADWALRVRETLARAPQPLRIVAHSFGCLAAVVAAADRPDQVADLILVAPADPERFDFTGLRQEQAPADQPSLSAALPLRGLQVRGHLVYSSNDPWLAPATARSLAATWQLEAHDAGPAGHINGDSGYGPWPFILELAMQPLLPPQAPAALRRGRGSALAAVRQRTRQQL